MFVGLFSFYGYQRRFNNSQAANPTQEFIFDSNRTGNYEIYHVATDGSVTQLTNDSTYDSWWPKMSPDNSQLVFYRTPKGVHDTDYGATSLWAANSDGTGIRQLIANKANNWTYQGHAEWSPDSKSLVMFGGLGELYVTDKNGQNPVKISTAGQSAGQTDPSWSPDGSTIVYCYQSHVWTVASSGGTPRQMTSDLNQDYDPYFSHTGDRVAFLTRQAGSTTDWGIRIMNADGSDLRYVINDGNINSKPAWSDDDTAIYFHRHPSGAGVGYFGIWYISPDGTNLNAVDVGSGSNEYPAVVTVAPEIVTVTQPADVTTSSTDQSRSSGQGSSLPPADTGLSESSEPAEQSAQTSPSIDGVVENAKLTSNLVAIQKTKKKNGVVGLFLSTALLGLAVIIGLRYYRKSRLWH